MSVPGFLELIVILGVIGAGVGGLLVVYLVIRAAVRAGNQPPKQ